MKYSAILKLDRRQNIPYFAFTLTGEFQEGDATVTVLRSPDNVSRIGISKITDPRFGSHCKNQQWVFSVQASDDDCNFLIRLPEHTSVILTWDESSLPDYDGDRDHTVGKRPSFSLRPAESAC